GDLGAGEGEFQFAAGGVFYRFQLAGFIGEGERVAVSVLLFDQLAFGVEFQLFLGREGEGVEGFRFGFFFDQGRLDIDAGDVFAAAETEAGGGAVFLHDGDRAGFFTDFEVGAVGARPAVAPGAGGFGFHRGEGVVGAGNG